ncbi:hypothetical protein HQ945_05135 [Phyllobacterium sp. BT25]|uniref:Uncharacterized protein n=2 Tax=Phyllobacterium pellucidum TaxID=2740464 RepID=A0A849VLE7_9HYPH|nr:hypothetical protein [Phyllobacterium pellucidum]
MIDIRVDTISQLFGTMDPFPFRERDLAKDADEYILSRARAIPARHALEILVHIPQAALDEKTPINLTEPFVKYFRFRAEALSRQLSELFAAGRLSLFIGLVVLLFCLLSGQALSALLPPGYFGDFIEEGLIIVGWVANWRPLEIFLYDWWPVAQQRSVYRRLAQAKVVLLGTPYLDASDDFIAKA